MKSPSNTRPSASCQVQQGVRGYPIEPASRLSQKAKALKQGLLWGAPSALAPTRSRPQSSQQSAELNQKILDIQPQSDFDNLSHSAAKHPQRATNRRALAVPLLESPGSSVNCAPDAAVREHLPPAPRPPTCRSPRDIVRDIFPRCSAPLFGGVSSRLLTRPCELASPRTSFATMPPSLATR